MKRDDGESATIFIIALSDGVKVTKSARAKWSASRHAKEAWKLAITNLCAAQIARFHIPTTATHVIDTDNTQQLVSSETGNWAAILQAQASLFLWAAAK